MIGNDLVDLTVAARESNWRRKGYLNKVFSPEEQSQIRNATKPDQYVWLLWSMKEAAYKIHSKITGVRSYAPAALNCIVTIENLKATGIVQVDQHQYYTSSELYETYIHTKAATNRPLLEKIKQEIYIYPDNKFEYKLKRPACVSHHGAYLALVY
jgi:phosphopantetheinyl transferase (holo-ACP synthase)